MGANGSGIPLAAAPAVRVSPVLASDKFPPYNGRPVDVSGAGAAGDWGGAAAPVAEASTGAAVGADGGWTGPPPALFGSVRAAHAAARSAGETDESATIELADDAGGMAPDAP